MIGAFVAMFVGHSHARRPPGALESAYYVAPGGSDSDPGTAVAPFASLSKAQAAMQASATKRTYVRAGTYKGTALTLGTADSGETWSYFPPDGYNSAILDGGASSGDTGGNPITILGASHITINGLTIQNGRQWGIAIHGGAADPAQGFPTSTPTADAVTISNNIIRNVYTSNGGGWFGAGIYVRNQVTNFTATHNAVFDQNSAGITIGANGGGGNPNDNIAGFIISNNAVFNVDRKPGDVGAIYAQDQNFAKFSSAPNRISNNFIRDYQCDPSTGCGSHDPTRDVAIYLDRGVSNVTVSGNLIANTANAIGGSASVSSTQAFFVGSGHDNQICNNIIDLGSNGYILNLVYEHYYVNDSAMARNTFIGNIIIGNWPGSQAGYALGVGPYGYAQGSPGGTFHGPRIRHNLYYNYGGGSMSTEGNGFGDASPVTGRDPMLSGWNYDLAGNSPARNPPVNFQSIAGRWGPPGYLIPHSGTAPSYLGVKPQ